MLLSEARAELRSLVGVKAPSDAIELRLLNEGHSRLCTRSEWTQANVVIGVTVAGDADYLLPSTVHRPLKLFVDGVPFSPTDVESVNQARNGEISFARGAWYLSFSSAGQESIALYPVPGTDGLSIRAPSVVYPAKLVEEDDAFVVPEDFSGAVIDYAASRLYGFREDNPELRQFHQEAFDTAVSELRRLRTARAGRGPIQLQVVGTA